MLLFHIRREEVTAPPVSPFQAGLFHQVVGEDGSAFTGLK